MAFRSPALAWRDSPQRFGRITRLLHWTMAALLAWQFAGMLAKVGLGKAHVLTQWLAPAHAHVGLLLLLLVLVRAVWGISQNGRRPSPGSDGLGKAAWAGHLCLYLLMVVVPLLAALRMWGNTRPFVWMGLVELNAGGGERIGWLVAPANAAHGTLGWILLALIAGHVLMVLCHRWVLADGRDRRMLG